ncbi:VENN motif pre-toxin domain-containing protein, partial [Exercitatus varius]|uniref:VENN motif pre-toxin domain-containing protein n=1 Tax=Exercitatus varius TaxID=67857 RepID=UPI00294AC7DB
ATYGKGGDYQMAVRAVTGVLQGLATGNQNAAWVNGLSPYANNLIKTYTTDESGQVNTTANLMAHAMLGALEAYATGNHAAAGAAGAITSEVAAKLITEQLYHTAPDKLTDDQKQVVATLSQVTAGLAGIVTSDSTQSAVSAAEIGKRAVENNYNAVPFVENIDGNSLKAMAEIQSEKIKLDDETKALMEKEVMEQVDKYAPHYISIDGTFYKITFKASINTRNGDVFLTSNLSPINMTSGSNISSMGLSLALTAGWYDLPVDIRHKELQTAINNAMDGNSIGGNVCFYACAGYSRTISWAGIKHGINSYSVGVGAGINLSIGGEHTWKYSENSN